MAHRVSCKAVCFSACTYADLHACSPAIKMNKTNCNVSVRSSFLSCSRFKGRVLPPLFCVCALVSFFFFFPASPPFLFWSTPGSEVLTTKPLHGALMWYTTQMQTHVCSHAHTHTKVILRKTVFTLHALSCLLPLKVLRVTQKNKRRDLLSC